jgi:RNA polymerase sigma-70 factor (ECF subfamily)
VTAERYEDYGRAPEAPASRPGPAAAAASGVTELFVANASGLYALALRLVRDRAAAEDVLQNSFLSLYSRWDRRGNPDFPLRYLYSIVRNEAMDAARKRRNELVGLDLTSHLTAASAEAQALTNFEGSTVIGELAQLPRRQREVLSLTVDGYSPAEIADRLGIEANAVRVHLHHARAKIRARVADAGDLAA